MKKGVCEVTGETNVRETHGCTETPTRIERKYEVVHWSLVPAPQFVARLSLLFAFPSSAFSDSVL